MSLNGLSESLTSKSVKTDGTKEPTTAAGSSPYVPVNKWSINNILDWLSRKSPAVYELHRASFVDNQITGETLLEFNEDCLDYLNIHDFKLRWNFLFNLARKKKHNERRFLIFLF